MKKRTVRSASGLLLVLLLVILGPGPALGQNTVKLKGDAVVGSGETVNSAVAIGGDVRVDGSVREDAVALGGSVFLGPRSVVWGDVVSIGGTVSRQAGAQVGGKTTIVDISRAALVLYPFFHGWWWDWPHPFPAVPGFVPLLGLLTLGLLLAVLAPRMIGGVSSAIEQSPAGSFFWGVLGSMSVFPIAFLLLISIIGIVFIPLEILMVGILFFLGYVSVARLIGKKIVTAARTGEKPMVLETLLGMVALWLVSQAPFVGWAFITLAMTVGFGGVVAAMVRRLMRGRPQTGPA